jgi:uncharacterized protein YkwD
MILVLVLGSCAAVQRALPARIATAVAVSSDEQHIIGRINTFRVHHGLAPLTIRSDVEEKARWWSGRLSRFACGINTEGQPALCHSSTTQPLWVGIVAPWHWIGENVAVSVPPMLDVIQTALENSPEHRDNMLSPRANYVGVGIAYWHSYVYVTEEFMGV